MGKSCDGKFPILPSTTRRGTVLNTSVALDSPSVISKLVTPPPHTHATHTATTAESKTAFDAHDVTSTVLDASGSLGPFLDATMAGLGNNKTPSEDTVTPVISPEASESYDINDGYIEFTDDFVEECRNTHGTSAMKSLLARRTIMPKLSSDPKFATSPIDIKDKDYDFSLDLSYLDIVKKEPFCGTENESAVAHMNELSTMSALFSNDFNMRKYFVTKIFPFSLKGEARAWFNRLPPGSIDSPDCLIASFFEKYFPPSARHAALQKLFDFKQGEEEKLPESWTRFCALIHAYPGCPLPKNELLDIYYNGLTIVSRTYLDSFADCVFRKRTPIDAEELMAKISKNYDDWTSTELNIPEPISPEPVVPEPVDTSKTYLLSRTLLLLFIL